MKFATLGPTGTCHENATRRFLEHHGIGDIEIVLCATCEDALEAVHSGAADYLVQCSAHPGVHVTTEKYHPEILVTDTFMYPTKNLVLLESTAVDHAETLGLVKATEGYLGDIEYPSVIYEASKPVVGNGLLEGKYDAGLTHYEYYANNPTRFRIRKHMGHVITTWLVFGRATVFKGELLGVAPHGFFTAT